MSLKCLSQKAFLLHCVPIGSSVMSVFIFSYLYYNHLFSMPPSLNCRFGRGAGKVYTNSYYLFNIYSLAFLLIYMLLLIPFLAFLLIYILLLIPLLSCRWAITVSSRWAQRGDTIYLGSHCQYQEIEIKSIYGELQKLTKLLLFYNTEPTGRDTSI